MLAELSVSLWRGGADGRYETYRRAAAREPDRARRRDLRAAPSRSDAVLPFRLPGRRVRLLRHDGQRPAALDLPHACLEGRRQRPARDRRRWRTCPSSRIWRPTCSRSSRNGSRRKGVFAPIEDAARRSSKSARQRRRGSPPTRPSNASIAASAMRPAIRCAGIADYLGPAALNRAWTLVNDERDAGNAARLQAVAAAAAATPATRTSPARSIARRRSIPTASIAGLKRRTTAAYLKGEIKV